VLRRNPEVRRQHQHIPEPLLASYVWDQFLNWVDFARRAVLTRSASLLGLAHIRAETVLKETKRVTQTTEEIDYSGEMEIQQFPAQCCAPRLA
jgi:hypothetical protein